MQHSSSTSPPTTTESWALHPNTVLEAAQLYTSLGWRVVPVQPPTIGDDKTGKRPVGLDGSALHNWQALRLTLAELPRYFAGPRNVGVILGTASCGLADVDLDCPEAVRWAPVVLPKTWTFGRSGSPGSHWLYTAPGAVTQQHRDPGGEMLVELRADKSGGGTGSQTVMPPSTHYSGQRMEWSAADCTAMPTPLTVDPTNLARAVARLAVVAQLHRTSGAGAALAWLKSGELPQLDAHAFAWLRRTLGPHDRRWASGPLTPPTGNRSGGNGHVGTVERARRYLARVAPAVSGAGGHVATLLAAEHLVRGFQLDDETALELLGEWNLTCLPPWSERELVHKVREAREHGTAIAMGQHLGGGR